MKHAHDPSAWLEPGPCDERYAGDRVWSGRVNSVLAGEAADLPPGQALDVGSGEAPTRSGWPSAAGP